MSITPSTHVWPSLAAAAILIMASMSGASSEGARTVKLVVPVPPGGAGDILARQLGEQIAHAQGASVVTENRGGAATILGTESVARAAPDGNTLLLTAPYLLINPQLRKVNYDPLRSFEPICYLVRSPGVFVVNSASPYRTLRELIEAARAQPGELTFASVGPGTAHHLGFEMLKRAAGVDITYVPYTGGGPAINALLGGHVTFVLAEYAPLAAYINAGTLRAIATSAASRIEQLPDVPTVAETIHRDYEVDMWWSLFAPAKTPTQTLERLERWFTDALRAPALREKLAAQGFSAAPTCGADFAALLRKQYDDYGRVIREAHIRVD